MTEMNMFFRKDLPEMFDMPLSSNDLRGIGTGQINVEESEISENETSSSNPVSASPKQPSKKRIAVQQPPSESSIKKFKKRRKFDNLSDSSEKEVEKSDNDYIESLFQMQSASRYVYFLVYHVPFPAQCAGFLLQCTERETT